MESPISTEGICASLHSVSCEMGASAAFNAVRARQAAWRCFWPQRCLPVRPVCGGVCSRQARGVSAQVRAERAPSDGVGANVVSRPVGQRVSPVVHHRYLGAASEGLSVQAVHC